MTAAQVPQITFWQVADANQKLSCLCGLVYRFFQASQRQLIAVPNAAAADYVDKLLWKYPKGAFIPHAVAQTPLSAAIVITYAQANLNDAAVLINLCPEASPLCQSIGQVHELFDTTDPTKAALSQQRLEAYTKAGYQVVRQPWM